MDGGNLRYRSMQSVRSYIRVQGIPGAIIDAVLNATIASLDNRRMAFAPVDQDSSIVFCTAIIIA